MLNGTSQHDSLAQPLAWPWVKFPEVNAFCKKQSDAENLLWPAGRAIGQDALWHALQRLDKQKESLANKGRGWISHRDMAAYYQTQEVTQLMRNAPAQPHRAMRALLCRSKRISFD